MFIENRCRLKHRKQSRERGSTLLLVLTLLPVFSWLSIDALQRDHHRFLSGSAHADLSELRNLALNNLADAARAAREGALAVGETRSAVNNGGDLVDLVRKVARLTPVKPGDTPGLVGFSVSLHAQSPRGKTAWRMVFVWRGDAAPQTGVWHLSKIA